MIDTLRRSVCALLLALSARFCCSQAVPVSGQVVIDHVASKQDVKTDNSGVVVWLTAKVPSESAIFFPKTHGISLTQKDKHFVPDLLVVAVGSSIDFPNRDPYFHNVFSLFNGKRFDLGLYQAGETRSVRFDREGISYIFCNIHPGMHAVVVALGTPFFAVSSSTGAFVIPDVPEGEYLLHAWYERAPVAALQRLERMVRVSGPRSVLPPLRLEESRLVAVHKDKFGRNYDQTPLTPIY